MIAVTSFHPQGYIDYGKTCLETLSKHWPGRIIAYVEAPTPEIERVEYRQFHLIDGWGAWLERAAKHAGSNGQSHSGYDYRYDALKFCRKVFAQNDVFHLGQFVWWIDADCIIRKPIPEEFLESLLDKWALAYMGRKGLSAYTETGVIGFNTKHKDFQKFRENYLPWITSGRIFSQLKGWHDCIAFDHARQGVSGNDLTPGGKDIGNVIGESVLGPYIAHLKGPRKFDEKYRRSALAA